MEFFSRRDLDLRGGKIVRFFCRSAVQADGSRRIDPEAGPGRLKCKEGVDTVGGKFLDGTYQFHREAFAPPQFRVVRNGDEVPVPVPPEHLFPAGLPAQRIGGFPGEAVQDGRIGIWTVIPDQAILRVRKVIRGDKAVRIGRRHRTAGDPGDAEKRKNRFIHSRQFPRDYLSSSASQLLFGL